jgi:hypothetical protein
MSGVTSWTDVARRLEIRAPSARQNLRYVRYNVSGEPIRGDAVRVRDDREKPGPREGESTAVHGGLREG